MIMSEGEALKIESAVSEADLKLIETMSKDSLESYVKQHFGIDMDKRIKASQLRADAAKMVMSALGLNEPAVEKKETKQPKKKASLQFVRNPVDGFPYPTVPWAELNPEWLSCDSSGKLI
jgi:hypothetical protein